MATVEEKRLKVRNKYKEIIGRNNYSQARRNYCYKKYSNGLYYSDCSSSISWTYREAGFDFGIMNTVGMWTTKKFVDVDVKIKNGIIQNPKVLRIGDMLLFAGTDPKRKSYGYVGHVEMVGEINGKTVWLYGHGSGKAKRHEMNEYCKYRYNKKTKSTPVGNTGLIRVRRFLVDDNQTVENVPQQVETIAKTLSIGSKGSAVKEMQANLIKLGFDCGPYGTDGEFGKNTENAVKEFQMAYHLYATGIFGVKDQEALTIALSKNVEVTGNLVNVRAGHGTNYGIVGVAKKGDVFVYLKETSDNGWHYIKYGNQKAWISGIYSKLIE